MALHFSANQFDREFAPKRLGNWEVAKWFPERPRQHVHKTRIIADDRGHLLPGVPRHSEQPWEKYITAWDFPRKITRKFAQEVTLPPPRKVAAWQPPAQGRGEVPEPPPEAGAGLRRDDEAAAAVTAEGSGKADDREEAGSLLEAPDEEARPSPPPPPPHTDGGETPPPEAKGPPCKGGELVDDTTEDKGEEDWDFLKRSESAEKAMESKRKSTPSEDEGGLEVTGMAYGGRGSAPSSATQHLKVASGKPGKDMPPLATAYTPFQLAKQCAEENLRHQPLPDMVEDPSYQFMESRNVKHPETVLPVQARSTAVSIRQKNPGPTHCTKSSIFRTIKPPAETALTSLAPLGGKDEKATKAYKPKITDMDLAIGWDIYAPIKTDGHHQPGGMAPSVFTIVPPSPHHEGNCGQPGGCGTPSIVGSQGSLPQRANGIENAPCSSKQASPPHTKPPTPPSSSKPPSLQNSKPQSQQNSKPPTPLNSRTPMTSKPLTPQNNRFTQNRNRGSLNSWDLQHRPPPRKAWEEKENDSPNPVAHSPNQFLGTEIRNCMSNNPMQPPKGSHPRKRRSHSSPNLTRNPVPPQVGSNAGAAFHKACAACHENPKPNTSPKNSDSSGYKMAFKAGKPSNNRPMTAHPTGGTGSTSSTSQGEAAKVKVPKPRAPFARRSYSISTLAPPFSLWPGNHKRGVREYPDHWRLASVYQHAFKPIPNRTRPLLSTVYQ